MLVQNLNEGIQKMSQARITVFSMHQKEMENKQWQNKRHIWNHRRTNQD